MKDILIILAITPPVTLLIGVYVGVLQTVIDWLDERSEAKKKRKEQDKIRKEREKLWRDYLSLERV